MKILIVTIICLLIIGGGVFIMEMIKKKPNQNPNNDYSGPVRPTDDLKHFRETGETISGGVNG